MNNAHPQTRYRHRQFGGALLIGNGAIGSAFLFAAPFTTRPGICLFAAVIALLVGAFFSSLTITIDDTTLRAAFGPGWITKSVPIGEIASARPVPVRWWYGWGIRLTPHGGLYNVSGWDAVEIALRNGRRFCLGTDQPGELVHAIESAAR